MKNRRQHPRYHLRWNVALELNRDGELVHVMGRTHDLSISGASILLPRDVHAMAVVPVMLAPPPLFTGQEAELIEAEARLVYSFLSPAHDSFRVGLSFLRFRGQGLEQLSKRLANHMPGGMVATGTTAS